MSGIESISEALLSMIASYYAFNMSYPKNFNATLLCIKQLVMSIIDKQKLPTVVTRVYSALDQIPQQSCTLIIYYDCPEYVI